MFSDKQRLWEFISSRSTLEELSKEVLTAEDVNRAPNGQICNNLYKKIMLLWDYNPKKKINFHEDTLNKQIME